MNYYINNGIIHTTEAVLDYTQLTEEQVLFFEANPNASVNEVLACQIDEPYVMPAQLLIDMCYSNYSKCESDNIGASGAVKINEYAKAGCSKSIANCNWVNDLYTEMFTKITQIEGGDRNVNTYPSQELQTKPYTFRECTLEYLSL
jgi:hypothetical protein